MKKETLLMASEQEIADKVPQMEWSTAVQVIEWCVLHAGKVRDHAGNHATDVDGALFIWIADEVDERTDADRITAAADFVEVFERSVYCPADSLRCAADGEADAVTRFDSHLDGFRARTGDINRHRIQVKIIKPAQCRVFL